MQKAGRHLLETKLSVLSVEGTKREATRLAPQQRERGLLPHPPQTHSTTPKSPGNQLVVFFPLGQLFLKIAVHVPAGHAGGQGGEPWAERGGEGYHCEAKMENK